MNKTELLAVIYNNTTTDRQRDDILKAVESYASQSANKPTGEGVDIKFGDYILVEQKRYGCDNEFYDHKVIGTLRSNKWMDVPAITHNGMTLHDTMEDVVCCICCGVCEEEVIRYRLKDVKKICRPPHPASTAQEQGYTREDMEASFEAGKRVDLGDSIPFEQFLNTLNSK